MLWALPITFLELRRRRVLAPDEATFFDPTQHRFRAPQRLAPVFSGAAHPRGVGATRLFSDVTAAASQALPVPSLTTYASAYPRAQALEQTCASIVVLL